MFTYVQYEEGTCESTKTALTEISTNTTITPPISFWIMTGKKDLSKTASSTTACMRMTGIQNQFQSSTPYFYLKMHFTCGTGQISVATDWCVDSDDCSSCRSDVAEFNTAAGWFKGGYKELINYTWSTESYLEMHVGMCTNVTEDRYFKYHADPVPKNIQVSLTGVVPITYACHALSTAPTAVPTTAPTTTAPTDEPIDIVLISACAVGATLLLVGTGILIAWRYTWLQKYKQEPWEIAMYEAALQKCRADSQFSTLDPFAVQNWARERIVSENLGVSAAYIAEDFCEDAQAAACTALQRDIKPGCKPRQFPLDTENPCFHDIGPVLCHGISAKGYGMQCPRDRKPHCSVVDALHSVGKAGRATQFLSWVWGYKTRMFTRTIRVWAQQEELILEETFIWVCFFW